MSFVKRNTCMYSQFHLNEKDNSSLNGNVVRMGSEHLSQVAAPPGGYRAGSHSAFFFPVYAFWRTYMFMMQQF